METLKNNPVHQDVTPLVSIIIIHYKDEKFLTACLNSVKKSTYPYLECIVVDNSDHKLSCLNDEDVMLIRNGQNLGFAEGCNVGVRAASGAYVFILNNDLEIDSACIEKLVAAAVHETKPGIFQPKMLDFYERNKFHSSAAGGMLDILGYPCTRGRIFDLVEKDSGQYDHAAEVFWSSGAALFAKKDVLEKAGLFDKDFFLYMEDIDLCWRVQLLGYKVLYVPEAEIYHIGSPNLKRENVLRMYYAHRNSLMMILKNYSFITLFFLLPVRAAFELITVLSALALFKWGRALALIKAVRYIFFNMASIFSKHKDIQRKRIINDRKMMAKMYKSSVIFKYILAAERKRLVNII